MSLSLVLLAPLVSAQTPPAPQVVGVAPDATAAAAVQTRTIMGQALKFHAGSGVLAEKAALYGVNFAAGSTLNIDEEGVVYAARVSGDTKVSDFTVPGDSLVYFRKDGVPSLVLPGGPAELRGIFFDKNFPARFYEDGALAAVKLIHDTTFMGMPFAKDSVVENCPACQAALRVRTASAKTLEGTGFPPGSILEFSAEAKLLAVFPSRELDVKGLKCAANKKIEFHPNGNVRRAFLAQDTGIQGVPLPRDGRVSFFENGSLRSGALGLDTDLKGVPAARGASFLFHGTGAIASAELARDHAFGGTTIPAGSKVHFTPDGKLESANLSGAVEVKGIPCPAGAMARFYPDGSLRMARLSRPVTIEDLALPAGTRVEFAPNGKLKTVIPVSELTVAGKTYGRGARVVIREDGTGR